MGETQGNTQLTGIRKLLAGLLTVVFVNTMLLAQVAQQKTAPAAAQPHPLPPPVVRQPVPQPVRIAALPNPAALYPTAPGSGNTRATLMYLRRWGVENLTVRATSSGAMIRFSYQIADANKAKILNDKRVMPSLILEKTGLRLEVPTEEKVGQLRQVAKPENGREYWMVFGNRTHAVRRGDRVDIIVGTFRADGLTVE